MRISSVRPFVRLSFATQSINNSSLFFHPASVSVLNLSRMYHQYTYTPCTKKLFIHHIESLLNSSNSYACFLVVAAP